MFHQIQERIQTLVQDRRVTPIIICDEAQYLRTEILNDLKILLNFNMDSKDLAVLILVGQPTLNDTLARAVNEALNQRIVINYMFVGIDETEVRNYIIDRCNLAGIPSTTFDDNAITALANNCNNSTRVLNNLIDKCLMICAKKQTNVVNTDMVMLATNDLSLV